MFLLPENHYERHPNLACADTVKNGMVVLVDDVCCSHYFGCPVQFLPDDRPYVTIRLLRE